MAGRIQAVRGSDPHAFHPLIEKGTSLPMEQPRFETFYTAEEQQRLIKVPVFEGLGGSTIQIPHNE